VQAAKASHEVLGHTPEQLQVSQAAVRAAEQGAVFELTAKLLIRADFRW
jgi:hypothetical protein